MIDFNLLTDVVEEFSGIKKEELISKRRFRHLVEPRMMCSNLMKENHPRLSLEQIGSMLNVDHSSVLYHIKMHKLLMTQKDGTYKKIYNQISDEYIKELAKSNGNVVAELIDKKYKLEKMLTEVNDMLKLIEERREYADLKI